MNDSDIKALLKRGEYSVEKASEETRLAMAERCIEDGHCYEGCCSALFRIYERCKWCGEERGGRPKR